MRLLLILTGICLVFMSCDSSRIFEEYRPVEHKGWHKDSVMVFSVEMTDIADSYSMYLNIRHRGDYPNSNIWLSVATLFPDGRLVTDTVELLLADPAGRWKGSGIGDLFDNQTLYMRGLKFPVAGRYRFSIKQAMRPMRLKGIHDVGMRLEKN
ncbi:MAG: gliding motility lipoprotein GldH [Prolixibacteraceae bacterium]